MTLKPKLLILAVLISLNTFSQERKIIGRILDLGTQKPIKDATIVILGTTSGTFSNQLGFFELSVDTSRHKTLIVSHIGFKTSEVPIPAVDRFKFSLEKDYILLNQVNLNLYPRNINREFKSAVSKATDSNLLAVESGASFPNGMESFYDFIGNAFTAERTQVYDQGFNITFTINENGQAVDIIISDSTEWVKTAVRQIFQKMPNWIPATQRQSKVPQYFVLPISVDIPDAKLLDLKDFYTFVSGNIKYPAQARRMGVEGAVYAEFVVDSTGNVINIKLLKDIGADCGEEVRRVIAAIPPELTKSLFDQAHFNKFILPVCFGLSQPFKNQPYTPTSDALILTEVAVTAGGMIIQKREIGFQSGGSRSAIFKTSSPTYITYKSLREALDKPKSVKRLSLANTSMTSFPSEILTLNNLEFLDLERNRLQKLPNEIERVPKLKELYLFENQIESLPINFRNLKQLKILGLASNQLTSFPPELLSLENLESLDLSYNQVSSLPPEIGTMKNLKLLLLQNNNISSIPEEFYQLKNLKVILIQGNPIDPKDIELLKSTFKKTEIIF